jgi:hypothetical protein
MLKLILSFGQSILRMEAWISWPTDRRAWMSSTRDLLISETGSRAWTPPRSTKAPKD